MRRSRGRRRPLAKMSGSARLTSLIDIMVTLLFFLLKSFVAEGEVVTPTPGVALPLSSSQTPPEPAVVVAVVGNDVLVGGHAVAQLGASQGLWIEPLAQELQRVKEHSKQLAEMRGTAPARGKAVVQGDRNLEFEKLQPVLYTLARSEFEDVSLAVLKNE